jgi:predicted DNA-binding transcriptional regulator AlpA
MTHASPQLPHSALINPRDAAVYLGCSRQWLAVLRMKGTGPAYHKHGSWVRYRVADLDAWVEKHRVHTAGLASAQGAAGDA